MSQHEPNFHISRINWKTMFAITHTGDFIILNWNVMLDILPNNFIIDILREKTRENDA